jgi:hypothetical protein
VLVPEYLVRIARRRLRDRRDVPAPGVVEAHLVVDGVTAFVDESVVAAAEQQDVVQAGHAAARPVLDVMAVDEVAVVAAGKSATVVARA